MMDLMFKNYAQWRATMTETAGLKLNSDYCKERIEALSDESDSATKAFLQAYGSNYRDQVLGWFEQAIAES